MCICKGTQYSALILDNGKKQRKNGRRRKKENYRRRKKALQYLFALFSLVIFDCMIQFSLLLKLSLSKCGVCVCVCLN